MNLNIINGRVWINSNLENITISIKDGKISKLGNQDNIPEADVSIDVENNIVFPGCVDVHSHLRDSEFSYKEDFISGTQAAVAGGFTTVLDMPNTNPPIINVKELKKRQNNAKNRIFCNVGFYSSPIRSEDVNQLRLSNTIAFKIYLHKPFKEQDLSDVNLIKIMNRISECDSILAVHAEDHQLFDQNNNHTTESEVHAINRIIKLAKQTNCKIHFVHVSTKEGIEAIKNNKSIVDISCEATPHHMILNTEKTNSEKHYCEPPLRDKENQETIFNSVVDGGIDIMGTDHAPHSLRDKDEGKPGFPGLEITLPLMIDLYMKNKITLQRIYEILVDNPIKRFGLRNIGQIKEGYNADLIVINENKMNTINVNNFLSKAKNSPFDGNQILGVVAKTIINGQVVFDGKKIIASPGTGRVLEKEVDF